MFDVQPFSQKGIVKRGGGDVEDDVKNLPYRSALKSFEVERSYIPRGRSKKIPYTTSRRMEAREGRGR